MTPRKVFGILNANNNVSSLPAERGQPAVETGPTLQRNPNPLTSDQTDWFPNSHAGRPDWIYWLQSKSN